MHSMFQRYFPSFLLAASIAVPTFCSGCSVHAGVYDPYYHDHHQWAAEEPYYNRWEVETRRDHRDFDRRSDDEKKEYWDWRHKQH